MIIDFILQRLQDAKHGLTTFPKRKELFFAGVLIILYAPMALIIGFSTRVFKFNVLLPEKVIHYLLPFTLIFFPCLPEELFFRGLLMPHKNRKSSPSKYLMYTIINVVLFVIWHPFNAYLINNSAIPLFTNIYFLLIVFLLGVICTVTYLQSGSIWIPVLIHWCTVFSWVFFLGGRNKVLEFF